jgi:hypothetical protein
MMPVDKTQAERMNMTNTVSVCMPLKRSWNCSSGLNRYLVNFVPWRSFLNSYWWCRSTRCKRIMNMKNSVSMNAMYMIAERQKLKRRSWNCLSGLNCCLIQNHEEASWTATEFHDFYGLRYRPHFDLPRMRTKSFLLHRCNGRITSFSLLCVRNMEGQGLNQKVLQHYMIFSRAIFELIWKFELQRAVPFPGFLLLRWEDVADKISGRLLSSCQSCGPKERIGSLPKVAMEAFPVEKRWNIDANNGEVHIRQCTNKEKGHGKEAK